MNRTATLCLLFCAVVLVVGCSVAANVTTVPDGGVTTSEVISETDASNSGQTNPDVQMTQRREGWFTKSLEDFDSLMASVDGYVYYYTFEDLPLGHDLWGAAVSPVMHECSLIFRDSEAVWVSLSMYQVSGMPEDRLDNQKISLDGQVYYYNEYYDQSGTPYDGYFEWFEDGVLFYVDPGEPITEDVIRRYSKLRKVEFNVGQKYVGFGSDVPLIAEADKRRSVLRENPGIEYYIPGEASGAL